jgi:hypothetical protein
LRQSRTGTKYYYRDYNYNMEETKSFYMGLDGFGITDEVFERYKYIFFLLINPTFTVQNDEEGEEFSRIFSLVRDNHPNEKNFGRFLNFEPIKILWTSPGSETFKGYAHSKELNDILSNLSHYPNRVPLSEKNYITIQKHFERVQDEQKVDFTILPYFYK